MKLWQPERKLWQTEKMKPQRYIHFLILEYMNITLYGKKVNIIFYGKNMMKLRVFRDRDYLGLSRCALITSGVLIKESGVLIRRDISHRHTGEEAI